MSEMANDGIGTEEDSEENGVLWNFWTLSKGGYLCDVCGS
jgi:hypothetical protein